MGKNGRGRGKGAAAFIPIGITSSGAPDRNFVSGTSTSGPSIAGKGFCPTVPPAAKINLVDCEGSINPRDEGGLSICRDKDPHPSSISGFGGKPLQASVPSTPLVAASKVFDGCSSRGSPSILKVSGTSLTPAAQNKSAELQHPVVNAQSVLYVSETGSIPVAAPKTDMPQVAIVHSCCKQVAACGPSAQQRCLVREQSAPFPSSHSVPADALGVQQPVNDPSAAHSCCVHHRGYDPSASNAHFCGSLGRSFADVLRNLEDPDVNRNATGVASGPTKNFVADKVELIKSFHGEGGANSLGQILESEGRRIVSFSVKELDELAAPFEFALVGKFSHGFPSMKTLKAIFGNFNLRDRFSVSLLEDKHVLIRLSCEEDYTRLWSRQVWYMAGFPMRVLKWTPDFDPLVEAPFAPVWVQLPYLPVHLFDRRSLFKIVSVLGKPLRLDSATAAISRPSCARVCIEIDLTQSPLSEVEIHLGGKMRIQEVEYENLPDYCSVCSHIGHDSKNCKVCKPPVLTAVDPSLAEEFVQIPAPVNSTGEIDTSRGPEVGTILISGNGKCVLVDDSYSTPSIPLNTRALREELTKSMDKFPLFELCELSGAASDGGFTDGRESEPEDWYSENESTRIDDPPYPRHMAKVSRKGAKDAKHMSQGRPRVIIPRHSVLGSFQKFYKISCRIERRFVKKREKNKKV